MRQVRKELPQENDRNEGSLDLRHIQHQGQKILCIEADTGINLGCFGVRSHQETYGHSKNHSR